MRRAALLFALVAVVITGPAAAFSSTGPTVRPHHVHGVRHTHHGTRRTRLVKSSGRARQPRRPVRARVALDRRLIMFRPRPDVVTVTALGVGVAKGERWLVLGGHGRHGAG